MTTVLSSKGQVVLPRPVRSKLGLQPGTRFDVHADSNGNVVLAPRSVRKIVRVKRDRKTGLPTFIVPPGTPPMTSEWVREQLADFPWVKTSAQTTDGHLAALAEAHGAQLVTLDTGTKGAVDPHCNSSRKRRR